MSIGNDDSIVRTLPSFENIDGNLVPSLPLELVELRLELQLTKGPLMLQAKKHLEKIPASITSS